MYQRRVFVSSVKNNRFPQKMADFLTISVMISL